MKKSMISFCLGLSLFGLAANVDAYEPHVAKSLAENGFNYIGNNVWRKIDNHGVVHRVGFGSESETALLATITEHQNNLIGMLSSETDMLAAMKISSALSDVAKHLEQVAELRSAGEPENLAKASGTYNGCTPPWNVQPSTSVSVGSRSASTTVGISMFGPASQNQVRLAIAQAVSQSGASPSLDAALTLGGTGGPSTSAFASSPGTGNCSLYAFGHIVSINPGTAGCGNWSDSFYSGGC